MPVVNNPTYPVPNFTYPPGDVVLFQMTLALTANVTRTVSLLDFADNPALKQVQSIVIVNRNTAYNVVVTPVMIGIPCYGEPDGVTHSPLYLGDDTNLTVSCGSSTTTTLYFLNVPLQPYYSGNGGTSVRLVGDFGYYAKVDSLGHVSTLSPVTAGYRQSISQSATSQFIGSTTSICHYFRNAGTDAVYVAPNGSVFGSSATLTDYMFEIPGTSTFTPPVQYTGGWNAIWAGAGAGVLWYFGFR